MLNFNLKERLTSKDTFNLQQNMIKYGLWDIDGNPLLGNFTIPSKHTLNNFVFRGRSNARSWKRGREEFLRDLSRRINWRNWRGWAFMQWIVQHWVLREVEEYKPILTCEQDGYLLKKLFVDFVTLLLYNTSLEVLTACNTAPAATPNRPLNPKWPTGQERG